MQKAQHLQQKIDSLPRIQLGVRPTPLDQLAHLSTSLSGPDIYMKRDDLTGLAFGGNKTRMLEFSLADALAKKADTIVTGAAVQSNYCRQIAAACAKYGLALHLVLRPERDIDRQDIQGNHLLQRLFGAQVTVLPDNHRENQQAALQAKIEALQAQGKRVYQPRQNDTIDLDVIAYVESALEIVSQCQALRIEPDYLYTAAADTTQAGLVLGLTYLESNIQVRGFSPMKTRSNTLSAMVSMANQAANRLELDLVLTEQDFTSDDQFVGERYGIPTRAGIDALHLVAQTEGILLDPVYTSKAMAALIHHIRHSIIRNDSPVIFMHTGGAPALFGYAAEVLSPFNSNN
ncbi:MAG: D-cysteine desulfhydrase family protein [Chloroflexota bacterium]